MFKNPVASMTKKVNRYMGWMAATALCGSILQQPSPAVAQTNLSCTTSGGESLIVNQANYTYNFSLNEKNVDSSVDNSSNKIQIQLLSTDTDVNVTANGIRDLEDNLIVGVGTLVDALTQEMLRIGLENTRARIAAQAGVEEFARLTEEIISQEALARVKTKMYQAVPEQEETITADTSDSNLLVIFSGVSTISLEYYDVLQGTEIATASQAARTAADSIGDEIPFGEATNTIAEAALASVSDNTLLQTVLSSWQLEIDRIRQGEQPTLGEGSQLKYDLAVANDGETSASLTVPTAQELQTTGLEGPGTVTKVEYQVFDPAGNPERSGESTLNSVPLILSPGEKVEISARITIGALSSLEVESITVSLNNDCTEPSKKVDQTLTLVTTREPLVDPFGQITGCAGEILSDYRGFSVTLLDPDPNNPTKIAGVTDLTLTEVPDNPNNNIPLGISPNEENANPFFFTNEDEGRYSFLLDMSRGQLEFGRTYILRVDVPDGSVYQTRQIQIEINKTTTNAAGQEVVMYTATSLDGRPITVIDPLARRTLVGEIVLLPDAERVGLDVGVDRILTMCEADEIRIEKTGDRAAAAPGDLVIYRILVTNLVPESINNVVVTDRLPQGFNLVADSVRSSLTIEDGEQTLGVLATVTNDPPGNLTFALPEATAIPTGNTLTIVYAAQLTPDAIRGSGENSAIATAVRNGVPLREGPAIHRLRVQPGILSDTGTIIGRVFVDKNFDGEQQHGEPGIPNAVIVLEDGNLITTDADGLFSLANVLPGYHTGVLDLTSLPGYVLAPNIRFRERNSQSRLVHLAPGGLVRMNFGVTPAFLEEQEQLVEEEQVSSPTEEGEL